MKENPNSFLKNIRNKRVTEERVGRVNLWGTWYVTFQVKSLLQTDCRGGEE